MAYFTNIFKVNQQLNIKMISLKLKTIGKEKVVAACDEELLGKTFREGKFKLEVKESFYKGSSANCKELSKALKEATIANLVGEETIQCAIDCGAIDKENVMRIEKIPHAQMVRI